MNLLFLLQRVFFNIIFWFNNGINNINYLIIISVFLLLEYSGKKQNRDLIINIIILI